MSTSDDLRQQLAQALSTGAPFLDVLGSDAAPTLTSRRMRCTALAAQGDLDRAINEAGDLVGDSRRALGPGNYETLLANLELVELLWERVDSDPHVSEDVLSWLESELVRVTRADVSNLDPANYVRWRVEALRTAVTL